MRAENNSSLTAGPFGARNPGQNQSVHLPIDFSRKPRAISKIPKINRYKIATFEDRLPDSVSGQSPQHVILCSTRPPESTLDFAPPP